MTGLHNLDARMAVVERRLACRSRPGLLCRPLAGGAGGLRQAILTARERLPQVAFSHDFLRLITAISWTRAWTATGPTSSCSRWPKPWQPFGAAPEVTPEDVREAATLVLPHRLRRTPFSESAMDENRLEETFRKHAEAMADPPEPPAPLPQTGNSAAEGEAVALIGEATVAPGATFPVKPLNLPHDRQVKKAPGDPHPSSQR